jgi:hypothetical protein
MGSKGRFISGTLLALCRKRLAELKDVRPKNCGGCLLESGAAIRRFHLRFFIPRSHLMAKKKSEKKSSSGGSKKGSRKKTVAGRVSAMMNSAGKGIASAARAATKAVTGKKRKTAKKKK